MELTWAKTPEDLEQIADLMAKVFVRFSYFDFYALRMAYQTKDPWYKPEYSRIVKDGGRIVAHVSIVEKRMRIGRSVIRVAGIGDVCTHPDHRMHSYSRLLMEDAIRYMRASGFPLTMLYGIPNYYHKFGYIEAMSAYQIFTGVKVLETLESPCSLRPAEPADTPRLNKLYNEVYARLTGAMVREDAHWYKVFDLKRSAATVAVGPDGRIEGYALSTPPRNPEQYVHELAAESPEAARALLAHFGREARGRLAPEVEFRLSPEHPAAQCLETLGGRFVRRVYAEGEGQAMLGLIDLPLALTSLRDELEARLAASPLAGSRAALALETDSAGAASLAWDGSSLAVTAGTEDSIPVFRLPQTLLTRSLIGHWALDHLRWRSPDVAARFPSDAEAFFRALFPQRSPYTSEADYF
ncbi:MAG: hypothetical protein Kow0059_12710 [Candidatus Sumerlaeia bacterium]